MSAIIHTLGYHPQFGPDVLTASETAVRKGIDNDIPAALEPNAKRLSTYLGQINSCCVHEWKRELSASSIYRSAKLNSEVGGEASSDHKLCLAGDVYVAGVTPYALAGRMLTWMAESGIDFQQLILEYGRWVHVAIPQAGRKGKREVLTATKRLNADNKLKTVYVVGLKEFT